MQRWLQQWFLHLGAGFMPQAAIPSIDPRAPSSLIVQGHAPHALPRRGRSRRPVVVTARPAESAGRSLDADTTRRVHLSVDPADSSRTRICGRMADVCDALDALIDREAAQQAGLTVHASGLNG
ncbi:hypothetical protein [Leptothrix discophora]|uniref:Uncharacterized protein n=1 Tax=Leptothrix discophora TaxID=89 RepID=A0ABT9G1H5_LEPDI|nr:hypothetical protein [Leptothrix discophora]MDP4300251.1 hypothetical protein [Leptothrix discophora]